MTPRTRFLSRITGLFRSGSGARPEAAAGTAAEPGRSGPDATVEVVPPGPQALLIAYAPDLDGDPDAGEIIWTWVPYDERDGRGKDRPVLVISRADDERVYAVRLTSKAHDGDRDYLALGAGAWDARGRPSWVDVEQIYRVHHEGMRREASILEPERFARVAEALRARYGWRISG